MNAHASRRREDRALVRAWRKSVFADHERVGEVHRAAGQEWLAVDYASCIIGAFAEERAAVVAVLEARKRSA